VDDGSWTSPVTVGSSTRTTDRSLATGHGYDLRVRAKDAAGNWSPWVVLADASLGITQDTSGALVRSGTWRRASGINYSGRTVIYATAAGASVTRTFTGRAVAWASTESATRGSARVYIDGTLIRTVTMYHADTAFRRVVYERSWSEPGEHTIRIEVVGTANHPRVDVDALIVIR
jgi:hypothetical protein